MPSLWNEGSPYQKSSIHKIEPGKIPPVNYDAHTFKSHSLTHIETSLHTQADGMSIDQAYKLKLSSFYGEVVVLRLKGNNYKAVSNDVYHWIVTLLEIKDALKPFEELKSKLKKVFITTDSHKSTDDCYHDPNYVLTLGQEAADYLVNDLKIDLYGTSWKSSDYSPGKVERPIHNTLFKTAVVVECLDLRDVPEDLYFLVCAPLPIVGASESPVVPMLFTKNEIASAF